MTAVSVVWHPWPAERPESEGRYLTRLWPPAGENDVEAEYTFDDGGTWTMMCDDRLIARLPVVWWADPLECVR